MNERLNRTPHHSALEWRRRAEAAVANLTPDEAWAIVQRINWPQSDDQPDVAKLTGGYVSREITMAVVKMLGKRAGILS